MENNYWWEMLKWDGEVIEVKPENAPFVQAKLVSGEGYINTPTRSISVKDIRDFYQTQRPYTDQKLIESAAQAFNQEDLNDDGSIKSKWVKKSVNRREYNKNYQGNPGYHILKEEDGFVWVAFKLPVHQIDHQRVQDCTWTEISGLDRQK